MSTIILCIFLDIACYKWRNIANSFLYIEVIYQLVLDFQPLSTMNNIQLDFILTVHNIGYLLYYCDSAGHIVILTLGLIVKVFMIIPFVYEQEFTAEGILLSLIINVAQFLLTTIFSMIFLYISQLHANMKIIID